MVAYTDIFVPKQHFVTVRDRSNRRRPRRFILKSEKHYHRILNAQHGSDDIYITKYPNNKLLQTIILDFDSDGDKSKAYKEVVGLNGWLQDRDINSVIVSSGQKGFHLYIQIPPHSFRNTECLKMDRWFDYGRFFNNYVNMLIGADENNLHYLDDINTSANLNGNIRMIGSTHPATGSKCEIILGEFRDDIVPVDWDYNTFKEAFHKTKRECRLDYLKGVDNRKKAHKRQHGLINPVDNCDLRELMPRIFGGEYKRYRKGYIFMCCPFHWDTHPSMVVTEKFYYCKSCGAKGNVWNLIKGGYVSIPTQSVEVLK